MDNIADQFRVKPEPADWLSKLPERLAKLVDVVPNDALLDIEVSLKPDNLYCWTFAANESKNGGIYLFAFGPWNRKLVVHKIQVFMSHNKDRSFYVSTDQGKFKLDPDMSFNRLREVIGLMAASISTRSELPIGDNLIEDAIFSVSHRKDEIDRIDNIIEARK